MTPEEQEYTFLHEMLHIWHRDHDNPAENISQLEAARHEEAEQALARIQTGK